MSPKNAKKKFRFFLILYFGEHYCYCAKIISREHHLPPLENTLARDFNGFYSILSERLRMQNMTRRVYTESTDE